MLILVKVQTISKRFDIQDTGWWNFERARNDLLKTRSWENLIISCLYRPFDKRWLFYHPSFIDRPRTDMNANLLHGNLSLITTRQTKEPFAAIASDLISGQHKIAAIYDRSYFFPLYLYTTPEKTAGTLFAQTETTSSTNLSSAFIRELSTKFNLVFVSNGSGDLKKTIGPGGRFLLHLCCIKFSKLP